MDTAHQSISELESQEPVHRDRIRTFTVFLLILIAIAIIGYSLLFTPGGNRLIAPLIQSKIESALGQPITLQTFFLNHSRFELRFIDEANNSIQTKGNYTLLPPRINASYTLNLSVPEGINALKVPIHINGTIKGAYHNCQLTGKINVFDGSIDYNTTLLFTKLASITLDLHQIKYQKLMDTLEYPHNSDTTLNGNITLSGLKKRNINANATLYATTHHFTPSPIMQDDNESFDFWSLLADKNGKIAPFKINGNVNVQLDELGILEQFVSYPLRTSASVDATLQGTQHNLSVKANAKAAKANIDAILLLHTLKPVKLNIDVNHADTSSLFTLLSLPSPVKGTLNAHADSDFSNTVIILDLQKAQTQPAILKREYGITQPDMTFDSSVKITLFPKERHYFGTFKSNLNNINIDNSPDHDQMLLELLRQIKHNSAKG